mmetsp:Transcript_28650/g.68314  ORF Transcript_28650/g.68314 Transcript_28650/m.68314 type:complete len:583 (+) Transcript_28650:208-1956(+)
MQSGRSFASRSLSAAASIGLVRSTRFLDGGSSSCEDSTEPGPRRHGCRQVLATSDASAAKYASHATDLKRGIATEPTRKKLDDAIPRRCATTLDGKAKPPSNSPRDQLSDDSYPTFTQYHHSLLKKYLTPELWSRISDLKTSQGTTIEDIIKAGLALPLGANPPRGVGVLVGDASCYAVFRELLDPIILEYHDQKSFADWHDPELPSDKNFGNNGGEKLKDSKAKALEDDFGVLKSNGAAEDADESENELFLLEEDEDDGLIEYLAVQKNHAATNEFETSSPGTRIGMIASRPKSKLRRHSTIVNNPLLLTNREADPEGKYIVSTRIRLARNLVGLRFPPAMSRVDRRRVERLIKECTSSFKNPKLSGTFIPVLDMTAQENLDLIERHILFDNPNEWTIASGLGRDWPDGRALFANVQDLNAATPDFIIWCNEEDHLRIMCLRPGGDIQDVFTFISDGLRELERELRKRGHFFAMDPRLGYLTSCPTNVGTTMRASVHVKLPNLGQSRGFANLVERLKLEVRGKHGETDKAYTGIFDISNIERLGASEIHLINVMIEGVSVLVDIEKRLEAGEEVNLDDVAN